MPVYVDPIFIGIKSEEIPFRKRCRMYPSRPEAQKKVHRIAQELGIPSHRKFTKKDRSEGYFLSRKQRRLAIEQFGVLEEPSVEELNSEKTIDKLLEVPNNKPSNTPLNDARYALLACAREANMSIRELVKPINEAIGRWHTMADNLFMAAMDEKVRVGEMTEGGHRIKRRKRRKGSGSPVGRSEDSPELKAQARKDALKEYMERYRRGKK